MKQTKTMELMVGMLIAAGIAALFVLAMKVSNLGTFSAANSYTLTARFENIGGLKVRSPVTAGGVLVGRVSSIDYDNKRYEAVVAIGMDKAYDRFPDDTVASIYTAGLLGEQYIALDPGGSEEFLTDGSVIEFTAPALVLEKLIGKFLLNSAEKGSGP
ncbi:MAG TPA: outer membrane lipid asymmetry maintenance protein MlaD [Gammaproteobacteria bacterium]|nr:outer membrane lipid asymmetry maintenance protein MlaD [Gammaproteobacteria bacterium]